MPGSRKRCRKRKRAVATKSPNAPKGLKILLVERDGLHSLMVKSMAGLNPAGWRLQRGGMFPIDEFEFLDEFEAKVAQRKLQAYVDQQ